ncbi:MAG: ChaN family lipoprotein, partial [Chitinophagaceae bacterium]
MKIFLLAATLLVYQISFPQSGIEKHFKIFDVKAKQLTTVEKIAAACSDANVIFFGEEHNDSAGHFLEATIFNALQKEYGNKLALSMEMFETDCQLVVNEYLTGFISEERFIKEARAWNNYKDYKPAVEIAKKNNLAVIAA